MKKMKFHVTVLTSLLMSGMLHAQVAVDPVKNVYKIGGSSEIFISYASSDKAISKYGVLDVSTALDSITGVEEPLETGFLDRRKTASATGDFNGDGADNVVTVTANEEGGIRVSIPMIGEDLTIIELKEFDILLNDILLTEQDYTRIRIIAGNFDGDQQDEFAICYDLPDGTITIKLFKTDSELNIEKIAYYEGITYYDRNFDITAGDVDGDGIDEILMVKNKAMPYRKSGSNPPIFISTYDLYILKYDPDAENLTLHKKSENLLTENQVQAHTFHPNEGRIINEMRIACGDLNNDGTDEVVVGWSVYYNHYQELDVCVDRNWLNVCIKYEDYYYFQTVTFLNTFNLTKNGLENQQNISLPRNYIGTRRVTTDQHIAMTLKCEPMDNLGRNVLLVNCAERIHVFGKDGIDMLTKKAEIGPLSGHYLNLQGNESFTISDLNPDTVSLNFNKELIILQSDKTPRQQLETRYNGKTSITIAEIDKITADEISFKAPAAAIDIPFDSSENIELSAFLAGDFDLNDAEVYFVGTPIVTLVKDLQQPIVILNAPPVHFDVFGEEIFDITNIFTEASTTFSAKYNSSVGDMKTTSVKVNDGMGFSSDFRAYAMAGGTGIETSIQRNWEKGRSFYSANSQDKFIDQTRTAYTEDYVLRSSMDYNYYKYPIYDRKGKKLGDIAVMNPALPDFSSAWESSANWNHPSYVFNHEPGNLLSYKQRKNSADFSTSPSDFESFAYDGFPVTSGADHQFSFELKDISSGESSFSYAGGTGASGFVKVGIEATVEASLAPLGIGGSVASDVRIGVSAELSANYHNSSLSTHTTMLTNSFKIEGKVGRLPQRFFPTAGYSITPYIYRSQSGALVLDYMVEVDRDPNGWWVKHYGKNPDLAFILPWRYATEKGSDGIAISKKQQTSDIQFYPPIVNPGDTVVVIARVHNFSLETFQGLLDVDFFLGDPVDGGVKLTNIYGVTGSSRHSTMIYGATDAIYDREEYLTFLWKIPDTVSCSPRIYAVIDPDNVYTEIHKNNNVGWNMLNIYDCQECKYVERFTSTENILSRQINFRAYPNPFSSHCQIRFSLPQPEAVQIDLYNLAGHKVAIITSAMYGSGEHEVSLNAENLGNGIYICRITAGNYSENIKLILIR
jgi:opacity protein-like surface antigen